MVCKAGYLLSELAMLGWVSVWFDEAGRRVMRWASLSMMKTSYLLYAATRFEAKPYSACTLAIWC
jgi:hypothetical protein